MAEMGNGKRTGCDRRIDEGLRSERTRAAGSGHLMLLAMIEGDEAYQTLQVELSTR